MKPVKCLVPILAALACILLSGCDKRGSVQVQVFITTKGGENVRLGNVPITVFDEQGFQKVVSAFNSTISPTIAKQYQTQAAAIRYQKQMGAADGALQLYYQYQNSREYQLHDAIADQATYRTDANGETVIQFSDASKPYYLVATGERLVGNKQEKYCWLERVTPKENSRIQLSNANLWTLDGQGQAMGFNAPPRMQF